MTTPKWAKRDLYQILVKWDILWSICADREIYLKRKRDTAVVVEEPPVSDTVQLDKAGRIVLPAKYRKLLGLQPGDSLAIRLIDDQLYLQTVSSALERAQRLMREKNPTNRSIVDELIAERRSEANSE